MIFILKNWNHGFQNSNAFLIYNFQMGETSKQISFEIFTDLFNETTNIVGINEASRIIYTTLKNRLKSPDFQVSKDEDYSKKITYKINRKSLSNSNPPPDEIVNDAFSVRENS